MYYPYTSTFLSLYKSEDRFKGVMTTMIKYICFAVLSLFMLMGCAKKEIDKGLKSPCVSAESNDLSSVPCGPRRPINKNVS